MKTKSRKRQPLRGGKVSGRLPLPDHILKPPYVGSNKLPELSSEYQVHDDEGIAQMRAACGLSARVLDFAGTLVRVKPNPVVWNQKKFTSFNCALGTPYHIKFSI